MNVLELLLTFSAVLGPLFLLPLGRPLGRFGVGGPTGSCGIEIRYGNQWKQSSSPRRYETTIRMHHLLLFPRPAPAPARRLRSWLGGARLGRRLFGPTVTHAWVCPPASESVGIKSKEELPWELWGQKARVSAAWQRKRKENTSPQRDHPGL